MNINLSQKKNNQVNQFYIPCISFDDIIEQFKIQNRVSFGCTLLVSLWEHQARRYHTLQTQPLSNRFSRYKYHIVMACKHI